MKLNEISDKTIAYACLDWGMGHVTRSIGIMRKLIEQGNSIIFFGENYQYGYLREYVPQITFVELSGYRLQFGGKGNFATDLWKNRSRFQSAMKDESTLLENYCKIHSVELIISDHRYGFYHSEIPSIFVTHQLCLPINWLQFPAQWQHTKWLKKFNTIWIPDDEMHTLSGKLSKAIKFPELEYIGAQSRFIGTIMNRIEYDFLLVLSGPDIYALQLHEQIKTDPKFVGKKVAVLHSQNLFFSDPNPNWYYVSSSYPVEQDELFYSSECIISRSGYSTIMDLKILKKKAILIPTPGQKEQEYLAKLYQA